MSGEDPSVRACKIGIARELDKGEKRTVDLFKAVHASTGHGRVVFDRALNEMVGAGEVARMKKRLRIYYRLTEEGRKRRLRSAGN